MSDTDTILQGCFIAGFSMIGISTIIWCIRNRKRSQFSMKKSASTEELTSIGAEDPIII